MSDLERLLAAYGSPLLIVLLLVCLALVVMVVRLQSRVNRLQLHYQRLSRHGGTNLEEMLDHHLERLDETSTRVQELDVLCHQIEHQLGRAIQRVGLVRFNPFSDTGGDQSFSIALLDGLGDGLVISSLFSRTETRVFAKPVQRGQSKYKLTAEEEEAIQLAGGASPAASTR